MPLAASLRMPLGCFDADCVCAARLLHRMMRGTLNNARRAPFGQIRAAPSVGRAPLPKPFAHPRRPHPAPPP